jgi:UPF0755 protein
VSRRPRSPGKGRARRQGGAGLIGAVARGLAPVLIVLMAIGAAAWLYIGPGPSSKPSDVVLPKGAGVRQIATVLGDAGVIRSRTAFFVAARLTGAAGRLKAGEYEFTAHESAAEVLADIAAGKVVRRFVVAPEGWTSGMVADAVRAQPLLVGEVETPPEGAILPDGYQYQRGEQRGDVIARMMAARDKLLAQLWASRAPDLPLKTPAEAVTLASIVEKETGLPAERPRIAGLFENRLRLGMKLESDPTVIYGISTGRPLGRGLTMKELVTATPYNTYRIVGLPPTPIANPGRAALEAVLNPAKTDDLYFVADGTGGHVFAKTLAEHHVNADKWHALERARAAGVAK